jgi:NADPH-dependent 2,4-dienoyl-CoA reductase/sulfur reductase-like enzyme
VAVANVIPSQSAGEIAIAAGLADETGWCPVDPRTLESTLLAGVHVLGDACIAGPIPKSASAANSQAKICALAITALLNGETPPPALYHNTCYSLVAPDYAISISGIYRAQRGEIVAVEGAGGLSPLKAPPELRARESEYMRGWFASILADSFGADPA